MKLLVAEDEPKTGIYLQKGLTEAGFSVDRVITGIDALQHVLDRSYDLLILDVMMPGLNGWDVLTKIRAAGASMRVLFLSARDGVEDRVKVLDLGADDYMVKPFAFPELLARVRVLLHRADPPSSQPHLVIGDLELDLLKHQAFRGGKRIDLTAKEFSLLEFMLQHRGEVLPKSLICALLRQNGLR
jgi:two-component system copper resistance phosphate regulon response regulator CusR